MLNIFALFLLKPILATAGFFENHRHYLNGHFHFVEEREPIFQLSGNWYGYKQNGVNSELNTPRYGLEIRQDFTYTITRQLGITKFGCKRSKTNWGLYTIQEQGTLQIKK